MKRLYLHYPFCTKLCFYCNFTAGVSPSQHFIDLYHQSLLKEINYYQSLYDFNQLTKDSFYLGGGTPSLMPLHYLEQIFSLFPIHATSEITLEINPETVTLEKAKAWFDLGINRVSLGWQSMNDKTLSFLGRTSRAIDNRKSFDILRDVGFQNISVDRILSVNGDEDNSFFEAVKECQPDHISSYQLSIEDKTVLALWTKQRKYLPLLDEVAIQKEQQTTNFLEQLGYERYETSNYAKKGKQGQHNLGYWNYEHWLAIGAGAAGFIPNEGYGLHYQNSSSFKSYCENPLLIEESESPSIDVAIQEFLMLGIRKRTGISKNRFEQIFHISWDDLFIKPPNPQYFDDINDFLVLKSEMIPLTNPIILELWSLVNEAILDK